MQNIDEVDRQVLKAMGGYWWLASPYTKQPSLHIAYIEACKAAGHLMKRGVRVYSPIVHGHAAAFHGDLPKLNPRFWMKMDRPLMEAAHGCIVLQLDGWKESKGVIHEIKYFNGRNSHVLGMTPDVRPSP